jgi:transcriptional regulator with XRE-family HTH domain
VTAVFPDPADDRSPSSRPGTRASSPVDAHERSSRGHDEARHDRRSARLIGDRLRRVRRQQGLSLADVQARSDGRWKAVVVGAYERGDRSASIARLEELARFYGVPVADLFPARATRPVGAPPDPDRVVLDLQRLAIEGDPEIRAVARFARGVLRQRGDHNGRVLSLRAHDLDTVALAVGSDPRRLRARLHDHGVLRGRG